jgi:hypothetical protein
VKIHASRAVVIVVMLAAYSWVTAGVTPFSAPAYAFVALPSVAFVVAYVSMGGLSRHRGDVNTYYQDRSRDTTLSNVAPWISVFVAALVLEAIGLSLGGRSTSVPTLSTTIDHLLKMQWERSIFCFAWLLAGTVPLIRLRQSSVDGH